MVGGFGATDLSKASHLQCSNLDLWLTCLVGTETNELKQSSLPAIYLTCLPPPLKLRLYGTTEVDESLGRLFDKVDLIRPLSNVVSAYDRPSTKSFFDFNEI